MKPENDLSPLANDSNRSVNDQTQIHNYEISTPYLEYNDSFSGSEPIGLNIEISFMTSIPSQEACHALQNRLGLTEEELHVLIESQTAILDWLGSDKERWAIFLADPLLVLEQILSPPLSIIKKLRQLYRQQSKQQGDSNTTYIKQLSTRELQ